MPQQDKTGPEGKGPKTGRQMGNCEGAISNGSGFGQGFGRGFGRKRFCPRWGFHGSSKEEEKQILEQEKSEIEKRLKDLEA